MHKSITKYLQEIGARGGESRSAKKIAAGKINIERATAVRLARRKNEKTGALKISQNND